MPGPPSGIVIYLRLPGALLPSATAPIPEPRLDLEPPALLPGMFGWPGQPTNGRPAGTAIPGNNSQEANPIGLSPTVQLHPGRTSNDQPSSPFEGEPLVVFRRLVRSVAVFLRCRARNIRSGGSELEDLYAFLYNAERVLAPFGPSEEERRG